ncbi:TetR/AcrR family transcriptional regulator [Rhodobacteraceae bacterium RKSG542]|nr:TetR/AcrR family transcriptional regulator [Pseudovibrio flavus]MTI19195.1 TetR/AcrR family transcriptional regulator [Pseudovibrio flavus]
MEEQTLTDRQKAVLDTALQLLVEGGEKALTTSAIARAAGCSKESLYKWFGDRDGLLAAIVTRQASKVRTPAHSDEVVSKEQFVQELNHFAQDLLEVISGEVSLALNRLAIGQASKGDDALGRQLLEQGRGRIGEQMTQLMAQGAKLGFVKVPDAHAAYQILYGLVLKDIHVRLLLGATLKQEEADFKSAAGDAVSQFMQLFENCTK